MNRDVVYCTVILCIVAYLYFTNNDHIEGFIDVPQINRPKIKWKRCDGCKYQMTKTLRDVLKSNNIEETTGDDWVLYFPCGYNNINKEISSARPTQGDQRFFIIHNADQVSGKHSIWKNLRTMYGDNARTIMPQTYVLYDPNERLRFEREYTPGKLYIMKKNIQRQKGLKICGDKMTIMKGHEEGYVVVQELLMDPYLIDGRKINMRFYLLIVCKDGEVSAFVHKEGFMYYTKIPFKANSIEEDHNITTGYIDREVYRKNPLTLGDFRHYLDNKMRGYTRFETQQVVAGNCLSQLVFRRINNMMADVVKALDTNICKQSQLKGNISYQLFGADVALSDKLHPQLIEINKGPDMSTKDDRDSLVKHAVMADLLKVVKAIPDEDNGFIPIV